MCDRCCDRQRRGDGLCNAGVASVPAGVNRGTVEGRARDRIVILVSLAKCGMLAVVLAPAIAAAGPASEAEPEVAVSWSADLRVGSDVHHWAPRLEAVLDHRRGPASFAFVASYSHDSVDGTPYYFFHLDDLGAGARVLFWKGDDIALGAGFRVLADHTQLAGTGTSGWRAGAAVDLVVPVNLPIRLAGCHVQLAVIYSRENYQAVPFAFPHRMTVDTRVDDGSRRSFLGLFLGVSR